MNWDLLKMIATPLLAVAFVALVLAVPAMLVLKLKEKLFGKEGAAPEQTTSRHARPHKQAWHERFQGPFAWLRDRAAELAGEGAAPQAGAGAQTTPPDRAPAAAPLTVATVRTPQEDRFVRLAITRKALTRDQVSRCLEFQAQKREQGSIIPLWDCAVLQNVLDQGAAAKLQEEAGDLSADTVGGFAIMRKLGEGGTGTVWLAISADDEPVALKILSAERARDRVRLTRFLREAQATIKLKHANLVRGVALGEDAGRYFFAMELVSGKNVHEMIEESGPLSSAEAARVIVQVGEGLAYAHEQGIIHRDIKPSNILVTKDGVAKLADLGLVLRTDADLTVLTRTGVGMGTPCYMAPEQFMDAKRVDARSDIYSLGATWYHMVVGQPPFIGATALEVCQKHLNEPLVPPGSLRRELPEAMSQTIERMMAKEPDERIQTALELCRIIRDGHLA